MIEVDIKPTIESALVCINPFDKAKKMLENRGYKIISLEENARLRMQQDRLHNISINGNRTREGVIYTEGQGVILTKNSPIMQKPKEATYAHRCRNEYFLTQEQVEQALSNCIGFSDRDIPTNRFRDDEFTIFIFGDIANDYGFFLREAGIKEMQVKKSMSDRDSRTARGLKPFAHQVWFGGLSDMSRVDGYYGSLSDDYGVRGIKNLRTRK